ncbi:MAG: hypothetical protein KC713_06460, partial [Candidatus Omnitrophica bacterium]|nr:hypothetical protein [Candidatus Omnitrophota bacterium]
RWAHAWYKTVSGVFLHAYRDTVSGSGIVPKDDQDFNLLLDIYLLEKSIYELGYELNNRPEWISIPLKGVEYILSKAKA